MFDMPRRKTPPQPAPNGGNGGEPPAPVDVSELQTALLGHPASRERLLEDMAAAHDAEVKRLRGWRAQLRAWLDGARPAVAPAVRRLRWLLNEARLSRAEEHERESLAAWLDVKTREIAEAEAALDDLTAEILLHRSAAVQLRRQQSSRTGDSEAKPKPPQP